MIFRERAHRVALLVLVTAGCGGAPAGSTRAIEPGASPGADGPGETASATTGRFCGDLAPLGPHSCAQQAAWTQCDEPWMDGFCSTSCGRCDAVPLAAADACPGPYPASGEATGQPYPRIEYPWMSVEDWCRRHARILARRARADAELVFFGDSITEGWLDQAPDVWSARFGPYHPLNAGVGGDRTSHMLWRIAHGALDDLPRLRGLVLLAGVNDLRSNFSPSETATGVGAILTAIAARAPGVRVLVLGVFPAEQSATDPFRRKVADTNAALAQVAARAGAEYRDIGARFLEPDGSIAPEIMADALHPTPRGYAVFAEAIADALPGLVLR